MPDSPVPYATSPTPPTPEPGGRLATFGWPPHCCADTPMRLLTPCVDNFLHLMPETRNCYELCLTDLCALHDHGFEPLKPTVVSGLIPTWRNGELDARNALVHCRAASRTPARCSTSVCTRTWRHATSSMCCNFTNFTAPVKRFVGLQHRSLLGFT